ncbi:molybdenum cofactor biosynthesis protein MoaE [Gordonia sp. NPDC058843]|uniref:molybdenum cofactor biosynthesis protein MoaE n=1 Tax=Gordonia sp. NPDC058843 TaxID=3346648 RepID=UPI003684F182
MRDAADSVEDRWIGIQEAPLAVDEVAAWVATPSCGAVSTFVGIIRDHSEGREGVTHIDYETYSEYAERRLNEVADIAFSTWPDVGRIAIVHRIGRVPVGESAVVCSVSASHRREAIAAMTFSIDVLKKCAPIWKTEFAGVARAWPDNGSTILATAEAASAWFAENSGLMPHPVTS